MEIMKRLLTAVCFAMLASCLPAQTSSAEASTDIPHNPFGYPLIPDMVADPSVVEIDGTFYCYVTTDGYGRGLETSGPPVVWKSKDFVNWSFDGTYIPDVEVDCSWRPPVGEDD